MNKRYFLILIIGAILISGCINSDLPKEPTKLELRKSATIDDVSVTFDSVSFVNKIDYTEADKGYKLVVITVTAKNLGLEEKQFPFLWGKKELKVDKGYKYEDHYKSKEPPSMRPEETKTGYLVFEILNDTYPTELYLERVIDTTNCLNAYDLGYLSMKEDNENVKALRRECIDKYTLSIIAKITLSRTGYSISIS